MRKLSLLLLTLAAGSLALAVADDDTPKPAEPGTLVIIDSTGKELKVKAGKFTAGVRRLSWLAGDSPADTKDKDDPDKKGRPRAVASGPEALIVHEELKAVYKPGVETLVPIERIRSIAFDRDKETMTVRAATSARAEEDAILVGTTAYKRINAIAVEADVDKGDAGIASLTFLSTGPRAIKGLRFPAPKVAAEKPGRPAVVTALNGKAKRTHKVSDLTPLYATRASGRLKSSALLLFRKTLRLDVSKIKSLASTEDGNDTVWQVVQKDGDDSTLTLLENGTIDNQKVTLVGLVGKVPAGYKLFPTIAISAIQFDSSDEPKEKEKDKDKEKEKDKDKE
jgi:hypothetical protein